MTTQPASRPLLVHDPTEICAALRHTKIPLRRRPPSLARDEKHPETITLENEKPHTSSQIRVISPLACLSLPRWQVTHMPASPTASMDTLMESSFSRCAGVCHLLPLPPCFVSRASVSVFFHPVMNLHVSSCPGRVLYSRCENLSEASLS